MYYEPRKKIQIRAHAPPPPFREYQGYFAGEQLDRRLNGTTLPQLSDECPPAEGEQLGPPIELNITSAIRAGTSYHSQLFRVNIPAFPESEQSLVAKFYDPFQAETGEDPVMNFFWLADNQYAIETTAYTKLASLQGTLIPGFFGSYTCEMPTGLRNGHTRSLRLILLECLEGTTMSSIDEHTIRNVPQEIRKNIMYSIVDAESRTYALGVHHSDIHPRNVILGIGFQHKPVPRIFDFGRAALAPFETGFDNIFLGHWDKAVSPILRWRAETGLLGRPTPFQEAGWIDWDWQEWLEQIWGDSTFYEPITKELEEAWILPKVEEAPSYCGAGSW
ncbi:MAG: hypothetical protein Q9190_005344 [Brigantiaea leucoxantha]